MMQNGHYTDGDHSEEEEDEDLEMRRNHRYGDTAPPAVAVSPGRTEEAYRWEAERQFYTRFIRFLIFLMIFFGILFFSEYEHDNWLFMACMVSFGLFLLYLIGSLLYTYFVVNPQNDIRNLMTQQELEDMEHDNDSQDDPDGDNAMEGVGRMAGVPFEETAKFVQSNQQEIRYCNYKPTNGTYQIVYNAVYFGKSIRSESHLHIQFVESSNGWYVQGTVVSGAIGSQSRGNPQHKREIAQGFVNARGEMYWTVNGMTDPAKLDAVYRGILDFRSNTMYDGEFKAGTAPPGRIVRMEMVQEGTTSMGASSNYRNGGATAKRDIWGDSDLDLEMVEIENVKNII